MKTSAATANYFRVRSSIHGRVIRYRCGSLGRPTAAAAAAAVAGLTRSSRMRPESHSSYKNLRCKLTKCGEITCHDGNYNFSEVTYCFFTTFSTVIQKNYLHLLYKY